MARKRNPIPPHAQKVFSGKIFDVWQWEQPMFDGTTQIFERLKRPNTVQVIAVVGEKILVQTEEQPDSTQPFPGLPGGRCDGDEEPLTAAKRELLEETGYVSDNWTLWHEVNPVGKIEWTVYTFIARDCRKVQEPQLDGGEKISSRLVSLDEFLAFTDDPLFYSPELATEMLRARFVPEKRDELQKLLFGH